MYSRPRMKTVKTAPPAVALLLNWSRDWMVKVAGLRETPYCRPLPKATQRSLDASFGLTSVATGEFLKKSPL